MLQTLRVHEWTVESFAVVGNGVICRAIHFQEMFDEGLIVEHLPLIIEVKDSGDADLGVADPLIRNRENSTEGSV